MTFPSTKAIWLLIGTIWFIVFILIIKILTSRTANQDLQDVVSGKAQLQNLNFAKRVQNKLEGQNWFIEYEKNVHDLIDLTYDKERTIDSVFAWQLELIILAIILPLLLHLILDVFILDILTPVFLLYMAYRPIQSMKSELKRRRDNFDENLPQFINHMCLGFDSGATISKAMSLAVQTLDDDSRLDFDQLLIDYQMHTDNPSLAFDNLSRRMPTAECRRFCNVTSTGLKNGNEMRKIFETEASYMSEAYRTKMEEAAKKKQNSADVISTAFIFVPVLALMVAPIMATNMM